MQSPSATSALSPSDLPSTLCPLLNPAEALFHSCLENLTSQHCHIQCKPRLLEVLQDDNVAGFLKICQRHVDFMVYRKQDWLPMVAIEFEDDSQGKAGRKTRDRQLVTDIFLTVGIPMLQIHSRAILQIDTLVHKLSTAWQQRNANLETMPPPAQEPMPTPPTASLTSRLPTTV